MNDKNPDDLKSRREEAFANYGDRAEKIQKWIKERGNPQIRVNPYAASVTPEGLQELTLAVKKELEAAVTNPDFDALLAVMRCLETYDLSNPPTDEAGYDTPEFSLAISEVDTALRHLRLNPKNAMRYLIYRYKLKMMSNNFILSKFVPVLHLEAALICNLVCEMCYQADPELQKMIKDAQIKTMKWDLFTKVIDEAAEHGCNAVVFAGRGEPTLNPNFSKMLKYCHEKGILDIKLNTNVMSLDEKKAREWLSLNAFLTIVFSVDAGDKEVFEKIRVGSDFDRIVRNIEMFNKIRREEFPNSPVRTRVNMTIFKAEQDPEQARNLWAPLVDEFSARNANSEQAGSVYQNNPDGTSRNVEPDKICRALFTRMYVWSDGTVNPCESDYKSCLQLGNAYTDSLYALWNGPQMAKLRIAHLNRQKNTCFPCNNCSAK